MGSTSSVLENKNNYDNNQLYKSNKIYRKLNCGCIFSYDGSNLELPYSCYNCLELIKNNKSNKNIENLLNETKNITNSQILINNELWMTEEYAIIYAKNNNISIDEFIRNNDILKKFKQN